VFAERVQLLHSSECKFFHIHIDCNKVYILCMLGYGFGYMQLVIHMPGTTAWKSSALSCKVLLRPANPEAILLPYFFMCF